MAAAQLSAGFASLNAVEQGIYCDEPYQRLFTQMGKAVVVAANNVVLVGQKAEVSNFSIIFVFKFENRSMTLVNWLLWKYQEKHFPKLQLIYKL